MLEIVRYVGLLLYGLCIAYATKSVVRGVLKMAELKKCKQCGEIRALSQYRKYYGGRNGTYTTCKICERINNRAKYLEAKGQEALSIEESEELQNIHSLWTQQRLAGLVPPHTAPGRKPVVNDVLNQMANLVSHSAEPKLISLSAPAELTQWLTMELTEEPEYYQDTVYEDLCEKYRSVVSIDKINLVPVYDETYKEILDQILDRFYAYEDNYYSERNEE